MKINEEGEVMVTAPPDAPTELIAGDIPRGMDDTVLYETIEEEENVSGTRVFIPDDMVQDSADEEDEDGSDGVVEESSIEEEDSEVEELYGEHDRFSARFPQDAHGLRR